MSDWNARCTSTFPEDQLRSDDQIVQVNEVIDIREFEKSHEERCAHVHDRATATCVIVCVLRASMHEARTRAVAKPAMTNAIAEQLR